MDNTVNSARNNKDFDNGGSLYIDGDGPTECYTDADSWEPRDAVKGDVARMLFYMAVRYEGDNGEPDLELVDAVNTFDLNEPGKGYMGKLSTLLEWNKEDPVDSFEIHRNNVIYSFQHNRNPFIDHNEYVDEIWVITGIEQQKKTTEIRVYPNPIKEFLNIEISGNEDAKVDLISLTGQTLFTYSISGKSTIPIENINSGIYLLNIETRTNVFKSKLIVTK